MRGMLIPVALGMAGLVALVGLSRPTPADAHPGIHEQEANIERLVAESPGDPDRHIARGRIRFEKREWDAALAAFAEAGRRGAERHRVALLEGTTYLEAGWPHMAKERFASILADEPSHPEAHLGRARAWMKLERPEKAAPDFAAAVATISPLQPGYVLEHREALVRSGQPAAAVDALDVGIARLGNVPALQLAAIDLQLESQDYDDALRRLDALLATSPGHPQWTARRGEILERAGRPREARVAYADALSQIQVRTSSRRSRRLDELEGQVRAALARNTESQEDIP